MTAVKSAKLKRELEDVGGDTSLPIPVAERTPLVKIKRIRTLNDWVILAPFRAESNLELPAASSYKEIGIVVGTPEFSYAPNGARIPAQVAVGDVVLFRERDVVGELDIKLVPYVGRRLIFLSERNIICWMPKVQFELEAGALDAEMGVVTRTPPSLEFQDGERP